MVTAHRRAYGLIHRIDPSSRVTSNYAWSGVGPLTDSNADPFLDAVADKLDYIGLDYYYPAYDQISTLIELANNTSWEAQLDPFGMYTALRSMHRSYPGLPIVITENGMPTEDAMPREDGWTREDDLRDTLYWVQRARDDGVPVEGYYYWSLTDNYEWGSYVPRFGLYSVDAVGDPGLKRVPTAAVDVYRRAIRRGGVPRGYGLDTTHGSGRLHDGLGRSGRQGHLPRRLRLIRPPRRRTSRRTGRSRTRRACRRAWRSRSSGRRRCSRSARGGRGPGAPPGSQNVSAM